MPAFGKLPNRNFKRGQRTIGTARELQNWVDTTAALAKAHENAGTRTVGGVARHRQRDPRRRWRGGRPVSITYARLMGHVEDPNVPGFHIAYSAHIIDALGGVADAPPETVVAWIMHWPRLEAIDNVLPQIPFNIPMSSDVTIRQLAVFEGFSPFDPESTSEWFVEGLFTGAC